MCRILGFVQYRFSMHLKEDKKLGRFPFSELKSVHNCAQDKLPKLARWQRPARGFVQSSPPSSLPALPRAHHWKLVPGAIMIRFQF